MSSASSIFGIIGGIGSIFGLATGGAKTVAGGGGTDSQLVQFMATPGETVVVLTPQQRARLANVPHFAEGGTLDVGGSGSSLGQLLGLVQQTGGGRQRAKKTGPAATACEAG